MPDIFNTKTLNSTNSTYISAEDYGKELVGFIDREGTIESGTFYSAPRYDLGLKIADQVNEDSTFVVQSPYGVGGFNPGTNYGLRRFQRKLKGEDAQIFNPLIQQHSKTILKTFKDDGTQRLFIGTGNFTAGATKDNPLQEESGFIIRQFQKLDLQNQGMKQINFGFIVEDEETIEEYQDIVHKFAEGAPAKSSDRFIIGGPTGDSVRALYKQLDKAQSTVKIIAPYIDSPEMLHKIVQLEARGVDVELVTTPLHSEYLKGTGGNIPKRAAFIAEAANAGADVYMTSQESNILTHAKAISIDDQLAIVGSHNFTTKAETGSLELSLVTDYGAEVGTEIDNLIHTGLVKHINNHNGKETARILEKEFKKQEFRNKGLSNHQYLETLANEDIYFTLSSSLGASYFHGQNLDHNLMEENGYNNLARPTHYKGIAESIMEYNAFMLEGKELSTFDRFLARSYDSGLQSGGLGNWLNREIFIPRGWGRVYKDEKGAIASIAGLAGKVLDESYMYYANMNPDWVLIGRDLATGVGLGALENNQQGMFQTIFQDTASFIESMSQSLGLYLALTAPLEMLGAGLMKDALDNMIKGTMIENTRLNALDPFHLQSNLSSWKPGRIPGYPQKFMAEFFLGDMGHQIDARSGGMTAYILEQRFALDSVKDYGRKKAFFDHRDGPRSGMHAMQVIQRGRAQLVLEGTFKPFLIDLVNPFDPAADKDRYIKDPLNPNGRRHGNAFDEFNLKVNKLIDVITAPVDLHIKVRAGSTLEFQSVEVKETIKHAKDKVGIVSVHLNESRKSIHNYIQLQEEYTKYSDKINSRMIDNNRELIKILKEQGGLTEAEARNYIFKGGNSKNYEGKKPDFDHIKYDREVFLRMRNKDEYISAKNSLRSQLGSYADRLETVTTNTGIAYKTRIAASLQDVLNMIPLNPLKWGMFNKSAEHVDEFLAIGNLFSFKDAAEFTQDVLTGQNSMSRLFLEFEPVVPDKVVDAKFLTTAEHMSNIAKSRITSADRILGTTWKSIKAFFTGEPKVGPDIDALTQKMRKTERKIANASRDAARDRARKAKKSASEVTQEWRNARGFTFEIDNTIDAAKRTADIKVANVDEAVDLLDDVLNYSHEVRNKGGISIEDMGKALNRSGMKNITSDIMKITDNFSGNIKAEKFLGGSTGYIAGTIFISMALNNIMQSTGGVSIFSQLALATFGEDEDIAVRFSGNRFLPTEFIAEISGINQFAVNLTADTIAITSTLALSHRIAKSIKTHGYMPYTFDAETIYKLTENELFEFQVREKGVLKTVDKSYLESMKGGHDDIVTLVQNKEGVGIRKTILTRTKTGFRTEKILQSFSENVPTKTFIFGSLALLAVEGARQSAGTLLQAMSEAPDDKNFFGIFAGMTGLGFLAGAGFSPMFTIPKTSESGTEVIKAGGKVASKITSRMRGGMSWALGSAALGGAIYVTKLVFDPEIKQKGSLDPLLAGVGFGIGTGLFKKSAALGTIVGLAAMVTMSAINWAGIRFFEVGRAGTELDPHTSKLVAQLSQFSTAVLESEKDTLTFHTIMAAYAGEFSKGKSILAKDPKSIAGEVQVTAKQSPLPFLQFFVAERVKGPRGTVLQNGGPDNNRTIRTYSLGIQSGALFGTSISVELPVSYTPGQGFFGFTYNSENNLMAIPNFAIKVGVWAGFGVSTVGIGYKFGEFLSSTAYRLTGAEMFYEGSRNFGRAAGDLFEASKFVINASEKISSYFIRHTVGIFTTLQGVDARMAFETYKNSVTNVETAADAIMSDDITKASLLDGGKDTFDTVDATKSSFAGAFDDISKMKVTRLISNSKHFLVGMLIGSIGGSLYNDVIKQRTLETAHEAGATYQTLIAVEDEVEKRELLYIIAGGSAGGLLNTSLRNSTNLIQGFRRGKVLRTAAESLSFVKGTRVNNLARKIDIGIKKLSRKFNKQYSKVLNNRLIKKAGHLFNYIGTNKLATYGAVFMAAMAFNYIKSKSEFGITTMMDRYIVYDKKGNAYDNYEQKITDARLHHFGVVAGMAAYHTAIIGVVAMPHLNQRATMLATVNRKIADLHTNTNQTFFKKIRSSFGNILFGMHRHRSQRETQSLLENLLTLDREADAYDEYLKLKNQHIAEINAGRSVGKAPTLDPRLQKIEDVLSLRKHLNKDDIKNYMYLEEKRRGLVAVGQDLDAKELTAYENFLKKMSGTLDQPEALKHLGRGFRHTAKYKSFARRSTYAIAATYIVGTLVKIGVAQGTTRGVGHDSYLDRIYNRANEGPKLGQRGPNGRYGSLTDSAWHIMADMLRLITSRDIVDINYAVDSLNGKMVRTTGQRLVSNAQGVKEAQQTISDLSEMLIIDNPNAYIATFDFGGKTLRAGDKGVTTSSYFQLQGPAQDISTATYSMAAKFIFNKYTSGKGKLTNIIDKALRDFNADDIASFDKAAVIIRNATGMMNAMRTSRKYSRATAETAASFAGDSLLNAILAKRQYSLAEQAWQPVDSLFTNMFFETVDKAKHRGQKEGFVGFLEAMARNQREALNIFSDLMQGGIFETFFRRSSITNVKFFSGSFGKPPKQTGPKNMVADISSLWHQTHDLNVQAELFKQNRVELLDNFIDKVVFPLSNHSIFAILPNWLKIGGTAVMTLGLSAVMAMSISQYGHAKTFSQQTGDMLQVFGRKSAVADIDIIPDDIVEVQRQLRANIENGSKLKWEQIKGSNSKTLILRSQEVVESTTGDFKARNIGIINVSKTSKKELIRFELSVYTNYLDDVQLKEFVSFIQTKGRDITNLFNYIDPKTKSRVNIARALTDEVTISSWLDDIGINLNNESIYDIFAGNRAGLISRDTFINATVEDFHSKFTQGLDKLYDITEELNPNAALFQEVNITMPDGSSKVVMKGELLDPNINIDTIDGVDLDTRRGTLQTQYAELKKKFQGRVKEIVIEEMDRLELDPTRMSPEDQIEAIQRARHQALYRIQSELSDTSTEIGAISRGAGMIMPESLQDEKALKESMVKNGRKRATVPTPDDWSDELIDSLHYSRPKGTTSFWDHLGVGGKGLIIAGQTIFDLLTAGDVLGSYLRLADVLSNPASSTLDIEMQKKELGRAVITSALGLALGASLNGLSKIGNIGWVQKAIKSPTAWLKGTAAVGAGSLLIGASYKNFIQPAMDKTGKFMKKNKVGQKIKYAWDNAWYTTSDVAGELFAAPVIGMYKFGEALGGFGKEAAFFTGGFLGGALGAAIIGIGLIGVVGISAPALALTALGSGLIFGVAALFGGKQMTSGMNYATREILKVPFVGAVSGMTDPYRQIRSQERFKHHFVNSPFLLGYIGDIINNNWLTTLSAAEDPTGRDQVSNLFGEILSEGEGYGEAHSAWKRQAADGLIGRPKPIVDEVIQQELKIRAQFYSDNVIGRYTWDQLVKHSDSAAVIRSMEAKKRAERIRIQEAARVKLMKSVVEAGGPTQAMKSGNPRTTAVIGLQAARLEQVYKDLDTNTSTIKVTSASITTHKSKVKNSDNEQADQVKQMSISALSNSITLDSSYTATVYIENNNAIVDYEKQPSDMNPILQQEAQVITGGKAKAPEQITQAQAYNSYKDEA